MDKYIDRIRLGAGRSLMIGNVPDTIAGLIGSCSTGKSELGIEKFGLFESATPNFQTYYPEIKNITDIQPSDDQYITPMFRMLSEVIVRKNTNPVDFTAENVLKNSMNKLLGQTIFPNHEAIIGNELGSVSRVFWQDSYKTKSGVVVPAGINGVFKIDAKSHPKIARNILMDPPSIHSNSVTVEFEWEKSHPSLSLDDFRAKLGSMGSDGHLIRRIATNIRNYHETSLVAHGADPFAQKVDDKGNIANADYANSVYSLAAQDKERPKLYYFNYREDLLTLNSNTHEHNSEDNQINETNMKLKLTSAHAALLALFALSITAGETSTEVELSDDMLNKLNEKLTAGETLETQLAAAKGEVETLKVSDTANLTKVNTLTSEVSALQTEIGTLKASAKVGIDKLRTEAKRVYTALKADGADKTILTSFETAGEELLTAQIKQYTEELENKFPSTCSDCGSHNVSKASAKLGDGTGEGEGETKITLKSDTEVEADFLSIGNTAKFILDK
jgi:hypothetical protein